MAATFLAACGGGSGGGAPKGSAASSGAPAGSAASSGAPAAAALPAIPPLAASAIETAKSEHYVLQSGPWGSVLVADDWVADTAPGGFVRVDPADLQAPPQAIHVTVVKRKPGETVKAIVQSAAVPAGYTAAEVRDDVGPFGLDKATLDFAFENLVQGSEGGRDDYKRAGQIAAMGRGDNVYVVTCYAKGYMNSAGQTQSPACDRAFTSFRPPTGG